MESLCQHLILVLCFYSVQLQRNHMAFRGIVLATLQVLLSKSQCNLIHYVLTVYKIALTCSVMFLDTVKLVNTAQATVC